MTTDNYKAADDSCKFYFESERTGLCTHYIHDAGGPGFCRREREYLCVLDKDVCETLRGQKGVRDDED